MDNVQVAISLRAFMSKFRRNQENFTSTHFPILHAGETFPFLYERGQGSSSYIWHFFFRLLLSQNGLAHLQENGC